jgi:hypothetical protein
LVHREVPNQCFTGFNLVFSQHRELSAIRVIRSDSDPALGGSRLCIAPSAPLHEAGYRNQESTPTIPLAVGCR